MGAAILVFLIDGSGSFGQFESDWNFDAGGHRRVVHSRRGEMPVTNGDDSRVVEQVVTGALDDVNAFGFAFGTDEHAEDDETFLLTTARFDRIRWLGI